MAEYLKGTLVLLLIAACLSGTCRTQSAEAQTSETEPAATATQETPPMPAPSGATAGAGFDQKIAEFMGGEGLISFAVIPLVAFLWYSSLFFILVCTCCDSGLNAYGCKGNHCVLLVIDAIGLGVGVTCIFTATLPGVAHTAGVRYVSAAVFVVASFLLFLFQWRWCLSLELARKVAVYEEAQKALEKADVSPDIVTGAPGSSGAAGAAGGTAAPSHGIQLAEVAMAGLETT